MELKEFDWSKAYIGNEINNNIFRENKNYFLDGSSERNYNSFLIKDYMESEQRYLDSYNKIFDGTAKEYKFKRDEELVWVCSHCGYVHNHESAPKNCPICGCARSYFGLQY